jgi:poly-gamma-glutamate synthesis protein (capsule biosynthesis protein)
VEGLTTGRSRPLVIAAVGDLMFHGVVRDAMHAHRDMGWSLRPIAPALAGHDLLFGNFELPVSEVRRPEPGCRADRFSPPGVGRALRAAGFDVLNFANNHMYDFGAEGVECTLRDLADEGPPCVGVGRTAHEARRPVIVATTQGPRVGVLGYATAHMAVDASHTYVACFPEPEIVREDVRALRSSVDVVIVSCHTGAQYNPYPAPETRELARAAIASGATVFLAHHPHVVQGWERIGHGLAVYSLGNFVGPFQRADTRRTFLLRATVEDGRVTAHEIVPCHIGEDGRPRLAEGELGREIAAEIQSLSDEIADGRSDDRHFEVARSRMGSQYVATWVRELRRGGPGVIVRKIRHFRPYHATLVGRMVFGNLWRRIKPY